MIKVITVDFGKLSSIKAAERMKRIYERRGYGLLETRQVGPNRFRMEYARFITIPEGFSIGTVGFRRVKRK